MVVVAPLLVRGLVSPLQSLAALAMIITGIFDRVKGVSYPSYILMPVWTGGLVSLQFELRSCQDRQEDIYTRRVMKYMHATD